MRMARIGLLCVAALVAVPLCSVAQGGEIFGGYSYLHNGPGINASGWDGSLTGNFNRFFGLEVDLSDHYKSPQPFNAYSNDFSYLFGPHFAYRGVPKVTPFAHVLVGGTQGREIATVPCPVCPAGGPCPICGPVTEHQTAFTTALGGGLDVQATRFVWIRIIQADYLREQFTNTPQNDVRLCFGVVLRFSR